MGHLKKKTEQRDFHEHSIMEQLRKIRFPTWFEGSTTALVFHGDCSPDPHNTSTTHDPERKESGS